jgi:alpha/beta superfamily hydrolase
MSKAPVKQTLTIPGPAGDLEALVEAPAGAGSEHMAILCHPHPQFQGTMHNKVVHTLARAMNDLGIPALRFNFRGVGASQGSYGDGQGEIDDIYAVADYVRQHWPGASIWLAGFSFGAVVAARAAQQVTPLQLISIAPAVNVLGRELQAIPAMPWLIVQGDADEVVPEAEVTAWVNGLEPQPDYIVMPGVGHFFHGHLVDLRTLLVNQLQSINE